MVLGLQHPPVRVLEEVRPVAAVDLGGLSDQLNELHTGAPELLPRILKEVGIGGIDGLAIVCAANAPQLVIGARRHSPVD